MKKNIAIVAGGDSGERGISLKSAKVVFNNLDKSRFNCWIIKIRGGKWTYQDTNGTSRNVDKNDFSIVYGKKKIKFTCVFNAIHGTPGEDGKLQGYFDMLGIPYTTCSQGASSVTFNKYYCKSVVAAEGVLLSKSFHFYKSDKIDPAKILKGLKLPVFVKPSNGGSSVGMSKVNKPLQLKTAIAKAFREDDEILIEEFILGREITCGIMKSKGKTLVFPITEVISKKEFFDYEAKYKKGMSNEITPADISLELEEQCKATTALLYNRLGCSGVVRMDYIASRKGLYFLEANTVPGLSEMSIVPQQARAFGLKTSELFTMMIEDALWRQMNSGK